MALDLSSFFAGPAAGDHVTDATHNLIIGNHSDSMNFSHCIIFGPHLRARYHFHLLVGTPEKVLVDRAMTYKEWEAMHVWGMEFFRNWIEVLRGNEDKLSDLIKGTEEERDAPSEE